LTAGKLRGTIQFDTEFRSKDQESSTGHGEVDLRKAKAGAQEHWTTATVKAICGLSEGLPLVPRFLVILVSLSAATALFGVKYTKLPWYCGAALLPLTAALLCPVLWLCHYLVSRDIAFEWSRVLPKLPIGRKPMGKLSSLLGGIRVEAVEFLQTCDPSIKECNIRANVFLPDYRNVHTGTACLLFMPDELRKNMHNAAEWGLKLAIGQGASGGAFLHGSQTVALRLPDKAGDWKSEFHMSDDQKQLVDERLQWVLSMPVRDPKSSAVLAVVNIDGLEQIVSEEVLSKLATNIAVNILAFADLLARQPKVKVSIHHGEVR
jgi:hypothetical protein